MTTQRLSWLAPGARIVDSSAATVQGGRKGSRARTASPLGVHYSLERTVAASVDAGIHARVRRWYIEASELAHAGGWGWTTISKVSSIWNIRPVDITNAGDTSAAYVRNVAGRCDGIRKRRKESVESMRSAGGALKESYLRQNAASMLSESARPWSGS